MLPPAAGAAAPYLPPYRRRQLAGELSAEADKVSPRSEAGGAGNPGRAPCTVAPQAAPAPPAVASGRAIWRSSVGQDGVTFVVDGPAIVVLKAGRHLAYDWVASGLASRLGCNVAGHLRLSTAAGWEREALRVEVGRPILRMDLIAGSRSFAELLPDDMTMLCMPLSGRGEGIFRQIGRAVALDCLTGNPDRFPGIGLDLNLGNLMLRGDQVFCIDNSLARFRGRLEDFAGRREKLRAEAALLLRLAADPGDAAGLEAMGTVMAFFHGIPGLGPQSSYAPERARSLVVDGFCAGVVASREIDPGWLDSRLAEAVAGDERVADLDRELLRQRLRQFHEAADAVAAAALDGPRAAS